MSRQHTLPRSLATSFGTSALDLGLFALFCLVATGPLVVGARWLSAAVGALANFAINRRWAFGEGSSSKALGLQLGRYTAMAFGAVTLATLTFWALRELSGWDIRLVHLCSMGVVWLLFSYPLLRWWVFAPSPRTKGVRGTPSSQESRW